MNKFLKIGGIIVLLLIVGAIVFSKYSKVDEDEKLLKTGEDVLIALQDANYEKLESLTSSAGLSWNEYPQLDYSKSDISKDDISEIPKDGEKYLFGYTDGRGDPIMITKSEYVKNWLYDHDYLNAEQVSINTKLGGGNSVNTILENRDDRAVVAYHFAGFNPEYAGMDWTTLYLVFDLEDGEYKLRGMAKDNWTI